MHSANLSSLHHGLEVTKLVHSSVWIETLCEVASLSLCSFVWYINFYIDKVFFFLLSNICVSLYFSKGHQ